MDCDLFDIALFRFPFSEREGGKIRPALVLSNRRFNLDHQHAVMSMITTARQVSWPSDVQIEHFGAAGLIAPSVIRWKLFTLDKSLYLGRVGTLGSVDANRARLALSEFLA